ncbi:MAG: HAMP domain-containing histidine kinase [Candidatus Aegiribacteria sp.]|nr:HAMP domain-containing histidine kinase [Candidatus Aegiribacteria sp.]
MNPDSDTKSSTRMIQEKIPSSRNRYVIVGALVSGFIVLSAYFNLELHRNIGYSHFAYVPIIFASFWWGRKSIYVAMILGMDVLVFRLFSSFTSPLWADLIRVGLFLIVATVIGELSTELANTYRALNEKKDRLKKTNASLKEFSKLRRAFLHIAIHDMKSPVSATTMLLHSLETLLGSSVTTKQKHLIVRMHSRLDEATSFLRDFQFFAALEDTSQVRKHAKKIDLNKVIQKVVKSNQDIASDKKHKLSTDLQKDLPPVGGVERLLYEVVTNLVTNAIKYTPDRGRIIVRSFTKDECTICVEVEDNGIGISNENQKKLFKEFARIKDNDVSGKKVPGIGLGLSIVKRIVEMHGGKVFLRSEPEKGSVFGFDISVCPDHDSPSILSPIRLPQITGT